MITGCDSADNLIFQVLEASRLKHKKDRAYRYGIHSGFWKTQKWVDRVDKTNLEDFENGIIIGMGLSLLDYIRYIITEVIQKKEC